MKRKNLSDLAHVCLLMLVPGLAAWLLGRPLIFPSLGPTAFDLALGRKENSARRVIGGHLIGVVSGFIAYRILAHGLTLADLAPALSLNGLRLVASGVASVVFTAWAMSVTKTNHAPACATTLIVSLGLLSGFADLVMIMAAVTGMYLLHRCLLLMRN